MHATFGSTQLAIFDADSWFYLQLSNGWALNISPTGRPQGAPLVDAWRDRDQWTARLGSVWLELGR